MKKILFSILTLGLIALSNSYGQLAQVEKGLKAITPEVLKAQLGFLASDWTEGRLAGEKGEYLAADYIASMLQLYGVKPDGDLLNANGPANNNINNERSYFQNFVLLKTIAGDDQIFKIKTSDAKMSKTINFTNTVDFIIRPSDPAIEIEAPVVFAGYGFISNRLKYNDFSKIDVKGKFILKISGIPKFVMESLNSTEISADSREIESTLKEMGATGIIEFNPGSAVVGNPERKEFVNMSPSEGNPRTGKPYASYSLPGKKTTDNLIG